MTYRTNIKLSLGIQSPSQPCPTQSPTPPPNPPPGTLYLLLQTLGQFPVLQADHSHSDLQALAWDAPFAGNVQIPFFTELTPSHLSSNTQLRGHFHQKPFPGQKFEAVPPAPRTQLDSVE